MTALIDIFKKKKAPEEKKENKKVEPKSSKAQSVQRPAVKKPAAKKNLSEVSKILKEPHISEKATYLSDKNKYVFKVYSYANKIRIKKAVSDLYGVRVKDVRIINIKRKKRILRNVEGSKSGYKKAIVTLEKGDKIEIMPH